MVHTPIEQGVKNLHTTVGAVLRLALGFILYLTRERHLPLSKIEEILRTHHPPYTDWQAEASATARR